MTDTKIAVKPDVKLDPKDEKSTKETVSYEQREAIMGCGCRIVMDAATYEAEGAHCGVHDNTTVVRVIKLPPVELEVPDLPTREGKNGGAKKPGTK